MSSSSKMHNLVVISNNTVESPKIIDLTELDLNTALQTTLQFDQLIAIFSKKINKIIPHSAYRYTNERFGIEINYGITSRYACSYVLKSEDDYLGEIKFVRNQKFKPEEVNLMETMLCSLLYPLRNATLYHEALKMAETDQLTQTLNRMSFNDTVKHEINMARLHGEDLSIIFLDIDHFKTVNDQHGHDCGDSTLVAVAKLIKKNLRKHDVIFRFGGEEFVILVNNMDTKTAEILAKRIRSSIESNILVYDMKPIKVTVSLGVSTLQDTDNFDTFIKRADNAMYAAKKNGRNQVVIA